MATRTNQTPYDVTPESQKVRDVLKPAPVEHEFPEWIVELAREAIERGRLGVRYQYTGKKLPDWVIHDAIATNFRAALDHYGTAKIDGEVVLVGEPYASAGLEVVDIARRLAEVLGCDIRMSSNSWHYPGKTIRFIFSKRKPSTSKPNQHAGNCKSPHDDFFGRPLSTATTVGAR